MIAAVNPALPDNTGYVAAAYLVFLALVVVYVAIMAARISRMEEEVLRLDRLVPDDGDEDRGDE
ncbi:MAG TPA: hypothetical protein VHB30_12445 [Solirubrobacteraceae bacterium]|jgi:hypothetical protein|nr:hypothetical protein [Solirubrobacteraceae bacterium]